MQNLIYLFRKFSFIFLFLFFEIIAFLLIFRRSNFQRVAILNSTNELTGGVYSAFSDVRGYFGLRKQNRLLVQENVQLRYLVEQSMRRFYESGKTSGDTSLQQAYKYIPCRVINNSVFNAKNYFTIDAGSRQGIHPDMGVISPGGIAGVVKGVSPNFSVCISVLTTDPVFKPSVQLKKTKDFGVLEWNGKSPRIAQVKTIPTHVDIQRGDTIETSGYSLFPEGVMVGVIYDFKINPDDGYFEIDVALSTQFQSLRDVYAVDNLYRKEQKALEDSLAIQ
jgi:rod shape-determining protein MreC